MENALKLIAAERKRQIEIEGWTKEHDQHHTNGELAKAAAFYAMPDDIIDFINEEWGNDMHLHFWPFELEWLKRTPEDRVKELVKAGALIMAEITRIQNL